MGTERAKVLALTFYTSKTNEVEVSLCFLPYFLALIVLAPLDVNRKGPIKAGRRLSQTLELYTKKKWDSDEEKS